MTSSSRLRFINFDSLELFLRNKAEQVILDLVPGGEFNGTEYEAGDVNGGPGRSFKFNIRKDRNPWSDFAGSKTISGYGFINLYKLQKNVSKQEAAVALADLYNYIEVQQIKDSKNLPNMYVKGHKFIKHWHWNNEKGEPIGITARFEAEVQNPETGELVIQKTSRPFSWDGEKWLYNSPKSWPLFNLKDINDNPDYTVLVVEGEKTAEAAMRYFQGDKVVVTTWALGTPNVKKTDWKPLANRNVVILPDRDSPGLKAANQIISLISPYAEKIEICEIEKVTDLPNAWDIADALRDDWPKDKVTSLIKSCKKLIKPLSSTAKTSDSSVHDEFRSVEGEVLSELDNIENPVKTTNINDYSQELTNPRSVWTTLKLTMLENNEAPISNAANVIKILSGSNIFQDAFYYDEFSCRKFFNNKEYSEDKEVAILNLVQTYYGIPKMSRSTVADAIEYMFSINRRNLAIEWLESLAWDGSPRLNKFFHYYFGAHDTDYTDAVSKNILIGMVRRVYKPGTKVDNMVILEGTQGLLKSTALQALVGIEYYDTTKEDPSDKDFYLKLQGKMLIELEELDSFRKADVTTLKKMLSTQTDRYRKPYAASPTDNPRTCVFIGTTNKKDYLADSTGNRRYWPIKASKAEVELIKQDREQIIAEAVFRSKTDETHWEIPMQYMDEIYAKRMSIEKNDDPSLDPWFSGLVQYSERSDTFSITDFLIEYLDFQPKDISKRESNRVGKMLRHIGFYNKATWIDGKAHKMWVRENALIDSKDLKQAISKVVKNYATGEDVIIS